MFPAPASQIRSIKGWYGGERDFPYGPVVKNSPANVGDSGLIPGPGRSPGGGKGNPRRILAWEIPRPEESSGLQSMGLQRVRYSLATEHSIAWR